jgi:hypothetical protein
LELYPLKES